MKGSFRLFRIFGIDVRVHVTFLFLLLLVLPGGIRYVFLILAVFGFVTIHELSHSLVAMRYGVKVREITLLPIGGIASMSKVPEKPMQEFAVSLAGPLSNLLVVVIFYFPLRILLGPAVLFHSLSTQTWPLTIAYIYWINLILAVFNLLPAFPMDGGRIFRALLATRLGMQKATRIAVGFGHAFALVFAYIGMVRFNLILILIAVFIYMAASSEGMQVGVRETLKKFRVRDILPDDFLTVTGDTHLSKVLGMIFHAHQEDFPVMDGTALVGFVTRKDIMAGVHQSGTDLTMSDIMRREFPRAKESDPLVKVQGLMQAAGMRALPVMRNGSVVGIVTLEDIARVYSIWSQRS